MPETFSQHRLFSFPAGQADQTSNLRPPTYADDLAIAIVATTVAVGLSLLICEADLNFDLLELCILKLCLYRVTRAAHVGA